MMNSTHAGRNLLGGRCDEESKIEKEKLSKNVLSDKIKPQPDPSRNS